MSTLSNSRRARAVAASPVEPGDVVAGKYRVERIIAAGGMGVVVSARHEVLKQIVAIKFLIPQAMEDQTIARFLREAKAAARIQSERVVRVYDCGTLPTGVPYMVMEHLVGTDLSQHIRSGGAMAPDEAVDLICSALEGVAEAHALGIVHRDLKPANLFLVGAARRPYSVKVLDFGISKIQQGTDAPVEDDLTGTAMMLGSPRYVSPEQARSSSDVDVRADVWSIGVILYELLDGRCPFAGDTIGEVLTKILLHEPPSLDGRRADVPAGLAEVIRRCLERDVGRRYASAVDLARALAPYGSELARFHVQRIERIFELPHAPLPAISKPGMHAPPGTELEPTRIADTGASRGSAASPGVAASVVPVAQQGSAGSEAGAKTSSGQGTVGGEAGATTGVGQGTVGAWTQARTRERRGRAWVALGALVGALVVGALARWLVAGGDGASVPASDATAAASANAPPDARGADELVSDDAGTQGADLAAEDSVSSGGTARDPIEAQTRATATRGAPRTPSPPPATSTAAAATTTRSSPKPPASGKGVLDRSD